MYDSADSDTALLDLMEAFIEPTKYQFLEKRLPNETSNEKTA